MYVNCNFDASILYVYTLNVIFIHIIMHVHVHVHVFSMQALHSLFQPLHGQQPVEVVLPPIEVPDNKAFFVNCTLKINGQY